MTMLVVSKTKTEREKMRTKTKFDINKFYVLYEKGANDCEIARQLGVDNSNICRFRIRNGLLTNYAYPKINDTFGLAISYEQRRKQRKEYANNNRIKLKNYSKKYSKKTWAEFKKNPKTHLCWFKRYDNEQYREYMKKYMQKPEMQKKRREYQKKYYQKNRA